ncbi:triosephosphate isomerase [Firmicutes bacterium CAG:460]|nr:triosephosphate isomerase [Firmicutes bacterium CAG:460]
MKYLICNFKNKLLKDDILKYNRNLGEIETKVKLVLCPPSIYLSLFDKNGYDLGAQDISSFMDRTITGEIEASQIKSLGATYVIVGHSERRIYKHEINIDFINKINNALENNLNVIYCVGETLRDKENGSTFEILEKQISEVLNNVEIKNIMIAYEPVWAIGTGNVPSIKEIKENIEFISDLLYEKYECKLDILYGGSVNDENIGELCSIKGLSGFLVGGASLDVNKVKGMILEMEK